MYYDISIHKKALGSVTFVDGFGKNENPVSETMVCRCCFLYVAIMRTPCSRFAQLHYIHGKREDFKMKEFPKRVAFASTARGTKGAQTFFRILLDHDRLLHYKNAVPTKQQSTDLHGEKG
jgi:hypothetical protein